MAFDRVFGRGGRGEMSTEMFTAVWLFTLWMAYMTPHSKAFRVFMGALFLFSLVCRVASALSGEGILWR